MLGAIAGDIIGSVYEFNNIKTTDFPLFSENSKFTDDTVLSIATADCILNDKNYQDTYRYYYRKYPGRGYGGRFHEWGSADHKKPYNSYGNGSAMRVSPVGFALDNIDDVLSEAEISAAVTHDHPEGIKGAQAVAAAIFMARTGKTKNEIKKYIEESFGYDLGISLDSIRPYYRFDETCQGSVPQSIIAFLESDDFEDAIRKAVSIGGDSDTIACIAGGIAEAFYGKVPDFIWNESFNRLDRYMQNIVTEFYNKFIKTDG